MHVRSVAALLFLATSSLALSQVGSGGVKGYGAFGIDQNASSGARASRAYAGGHYTMVERVDGTLFQWGNFDVAQAIPSLPYQQVGGISIGENHGLATDFSGTVYAWGFNTNGQLNIPDGLKSNFVAAGNGFSVAASNTPYWPAVCWGSNIYGQCSPPEDLIRVWKVAAGFGHAVALTFDGTVRCWGLNNLGQCDVPGGLNDVAEVAAGNSFTVALKNDGTVIAWGDNSKGQCDVPVGLDHVLSISAGYNHVVAVTIDFLTMTTDVVAWGGNTLGATNVPTALATEKVFWARAGGNRSVAVTDEGAIYEWGSDFGATYSGQVPNVQKGAVQVSNSFLHNLVLQSDGTVSAFGRNTNGECNVPAGLTGVVDVAAGDGFSLALKSDGTVVGWGNHFAPLVPGGLDNVVDISAGSFHALALKNDGTIVGWDLWGPTFDPPSGLTNVTQIATSSGHCMVLIGDGTVQAWGFNTNGECDVPAGLTDVVQVAAGSGVSYALKSDGTVVHWGQALQEGGDAVVDSLTDVAKIYASDSFGFAQLNDGTIVSWGLPAFAKSLTPSSIVGAAALSAGLGSIFALPTFSIEVVPFDLVMGVGGEGTITMAVAPGAGGVDITLSSSDMRVGLPAMVHVDAGMRTATFPISVGNDPNNYYAIITATDGTLTQKASLNAVLPPNTIWYVSDTNDEPVGGSNELSQIGVHLHEPATMDVIVDLSTDDPSITLPATATILAGESSVVVPVVHHIVGTETEVKLTASYNGYAASTYFDVQPLELNSLQMPFNTYGGRIVNATVRLESQAGPAVTVALSSDNPAAVVPSTVTFDLNNEAASFPVTVANVGAPTSAVITATLPSGVKTWTLNITPNSAKTFTLSPARVVGGSTAVVTGTVNLWGAVSVETQIPLSVTAGAGLIGVPAFVTVPAGSRVGTFAVTHQAVATTTVASIGVELNGVSKSVNLTLDPSAVKLSLALKSVIGGSNIVLTGTVRLAKPATSDTTIPLTTSDPDAAIVPAFAVVIAGNTTGNFVVNHKDVTAIRSVTIGAGAASAALTVKPNNVALHTITPSTAVGGSSTPITGVVELLAPVVNNTLVVLTNVNGSHATAPTSVTIVAGEKTASYSITTKAVTANKTIRIKATKGSVTKTASFVITP